MSDYADDAGGEQAPAPRTYENAEAELADEIRRCCPVLHVVPLGYRADGFVRVEAALPLRATRAPEGQRVARVLEISRMLWISENRERADYIIDEFVAMFAIREETEPTPTTFGLLGNGLAS